GEETVVRSRQHAALHAAVGAEDVEVRVAADKLLQRPFEHAPAGACIVAPHLGNARQDRQHRLGPGQRLAVTARGDEIERPHGVPRLGHVAVEAVAGIDDGQGDGGQKGQSEQEQQSDPQRQSRAARPLGLRLVHAALGCRLASACAIAALSVSALKGLVMTKTGSTVRPVSRYSGKPVMKITGTSDDFRISWTATMPLSPSLSWMSARMSWGLVRRASARASFSRSATPQTLWPISSTIDAMSSAMILSSSMIITEAGA